VDIMEKKQERAGLAKTARTLLTLAEEGKRSLSAQEEEQFDRLMAQCDGIDAMIEREEKIRAQERKIAEGTEGKADDGTGTRGGGKGGAPGDRSKGAEGELEIEAFRAFVRGGQRGLSAEHARALNMGVDAEGGYTLAPQQWVNQLIKFVDDQVLFRGLANTMTLSEGESLGVPTLDNDLNDWDWTSEVATGTQDDSIRFGKREFRPNPLAKRVKISDTLIRRSAMNPEQIVRDRMGYKLGVTQERAFMIGDGNKKPLGVFTASTDGISTGRDVTFGAAGAIPLTPRAVAVAPRHPARDPQAQGQQRRVPVAAGPAGRPAGHHPRGALPGVGVRAEHRHLGQLRRSARRLLVLLDR
jgi:HK97 family phage major capsid protein